MDKKTKSISLGIAILASLNGQAQTIKETPPVEPPQNTADKLQELVESGNLVIQPNGSVSIKKSVFEILRDRGVLEDAALSHSTDTGAGGSCSCRTR